MQMLRELRVAGVNTWCALMLGTDQDVHSDVQGALATARGTFLATLAANKMDIMEWAAAMSQPGVWVDDALILVRSALLHASAPVI